MTGAGPPSAVSSQMPLLASLVPAYHAGIAFLAVGVWVACLGTLSPAPHRWRLGALVGLCALAGSTLAGHGLGAAIAHGEPARALATLTVLAVVGCWAAAPVAAAGALGATIAAGLPWRMDRVAVPLGLALAGSYAAVQLFVLARSVANEAAMERMILEHPEFAEHVMGDCTGGTSCSPSSSRPGWSR